MSTNRSVRRSTSGGWGRLLSWSRRGTRDASYINCSSGVHVRSMASYALTAALGEPSLGKYGSASFS